MFILTERSQKLYCHKQAYFSLQLWISANCKYSKPEKTGGSICFYSEIHCSPHPTKKQASTLYNQYIMFQETLRTWHFIHNLTYCHFSERSWEGSPFWHSKFWWIVPYAMLTTNNTLWYTPSYNHAFIVVTWPCSKSTYQQPKTGNLKDKGQPMQWCEI